MANLRIYGIIQSGITTAEAAAVTMGSQYKGKTWQTGSGAVYYKIIVPFYDTAGAQHIKVTVKTNKGSKETDVYLADDLDYRLDFKY